MEKIKKKENEEGGYINSRHVDRGKPGIPADGTQTPIHPQSRSEHTRTGHRGNDGPSIRHREFLPPLFQTGFTLKRVSEFYLLVLMVYGERKTRRQWGYADGLGASSTGGLKSTWNSTRVRLSKSAPGVGISRAHLLSTLSILPGLIPYAGGTSPLGNQPLGLVQRPSESGGGDL